MPPTLLELFLLVLDLRRDVIRRRDEPARIERRCLVGPAGRSESKSNKSSVRFLDIGLTPKTWKGGYLLAVFQKC